MQKIPLTQGQYAQVDDADYIEIAQHKWYAKWNPKSRTFYAQRRVNRTEWTTMHQSILGTGRGERSDHIDHNGINNQRFNLRPCTPHQNNGNAMKHKPGLSQFKGVSWDKKKRNWRAYIYRDGRTKSLGRFHVECDAARAYDAAARRYFGEFACLNFPNEAQ